MTLIHTLENTVSLKIEKLPSGLRSHIGRVVSIAQELAVRHDLDANRVRIAAMAHDIVRNMKGEHLITKAKELGIPITNFEKQLPMILHGPVAAEMLRTYEDMRDPDIYDAIYWHSTGHHRLGGIGKVVFLADKLDPQKASRYESIDQVHQKALINLDAATLQFLDIELARLIRGGRCIHPESIQARNKLLSSG